MVQLEDRLAAILGLKVDLAPADTLRDYVRNDADREAVHAF
jgi:predicted nucleotidyltransferase